MAGKLPMILSSAHFFCRLFVPHPPVSAGDNQVSAGAVKKAIESHL
jgi:hypothetical protein